MSLSTTIATTGAGVGALGLSTDGILFGATGLAITAIDVENVGDEGGWPVVASGVFPISQGVYVWVVVPKIASPGYTREPCYSGVQGQGTLCKSTDGTTLKFVVPPLPITPKPGVPTPFNPFDLYAETEDGLLSTTASGILTVIHRTYTTRLYSLRAAWPPPRDVGPYRIDDEDYGG